MKNTRQRAAIHAALERAAGFRSAQEIFDDVRGSGQRVGLATVYRTLQAMEEADQVDSIRREDGEVIYRRCEVPHHHHHLVCRSCGFSVEVDNDDVERWADRSAKRHGFVEVTHDLEIFGLCQRCA